MRCFNTGCGLALALCLMLGTGRAQAQIITVDLNIQAEAENSFSGTSAPYVIATLQNVGSNVDVTVTVGPGGGTFSQFDFNSPGTVDITSLPSKWVSTPNLNLDGLGTFTQSVNEDTGGSPASSISFVVDNASISQFTANAKGYLFMSRWFSAGSPSTIGGYVAAVPEPGPLLGAGVVTLMGLGYTWRRRRQATA